MVSRSLARWLSRIVWRLMLLAAPAVASACAAGDRLEGLPPAGRPPRADAGSVDEPATVLTEPDAGSMPDAGPLPDTDAGLDAAAQAVGSDARIAAMGDAETPSANKLDGGIQPYAVRTGASLARQRRLPVACTEAVGAVDEVSPCFVAEGAAGHYALDLDCASLLASSMDRPFYALAEAAPGQLLAARGDVLSALEFGPDGPAVATVVDLAGTRVPMDSLGRWAVATTRDGVPLTSALSEIEVVGLDGHLVRVGTAAVPPIYIRTLEVAGDGQLRNVAVLSAGHSVPDPRTGLPVYRFGLYSLHQSGDGTWNVSDLGLGEARPLGAVRFSRDGSRLFAAGPSGQNPGVYVYDVALDLSASQGVLTLRNRRLFGGPMVGADGTGPSTLGVLADDTVLVGLPGADGGQGARLRFVRPDGTPHAGELVIPGTRLHDLEFVGGDARTMLLSVEGAPGGSHIYAVPLNLPGLQDGVTCGEDQPGRQPQTYLAPARMREAR